MTVRIEKADLADPQVRQMIAFHQQDMEDMSPPGTSYALDLAGLSGPQVTVLGAWESADLLAMGALKRLAPGHAELKSMRTLPEHLRRGLAKAILEALITMARAEGVTRLSLETGTTDEFEPAISLYTRYGFTRGEAFGAYRNGPDNQCYHLELG